MKYTAQFFHIKTVSVLFESTKLRVLLGSVGYLCRGMGGLGVYGWLGSDSCVGQVGCLSL